MKPEKRLDEASKQLRLAAADDEFPAHLEEGASRIQENVETLEQILATTGGEQP